MNYDTIFKTAKLLSKDLFPDDILKYRERVIDSLNINKLIESNREKYKYTPLVNIIDGEYTFNAAGIAEKKTDINILSNLDAVKIITVNGVCNSNEIKSEDGFVYGNLTVALNSSEYGKIARKYYNQLVDNADLPVALNTAIVFSGIFVAVKQGVKPQKPLIIINITDTQIPVMNVLHNLFVFGENCSADIMIYNIDKSDVPVLTNTVSETVIGKHAKINVLHLTEINRTAKMFSSDYYKQYENSSLTHTNVVLEGDLIRRNTEVLLAEKQCECNLYGLSIANNSQHIDNHTLIDHAATESSSNELYKSIVDDKAVNIFNGRILVRKNSQKTAAYQSNKNILLNTNAKIYTKPQLEIYADDVKCSHGATVGQLNEDTLFYMQARGVDKRTAQRLILSGFANETLAKINHSDFYEFLVSKIESKLIDSPPLYADKYRKE